LTLAFVFSIFSGFIINIISILDAARKRMSVAFFQSLDTFFRHTFSILLVYCFLANSKYVFIGYIFASATLFYIFYLVYRSNIDLIGFSYDKVWVLNIWSYIRPFMIWGIFTWIQLSSDKWALAYFKSSNDVGLYSALYQIGFLPISIFVGFGVQLLTPIVFEKVGDGKNNESFIHIDKMITTVSIYIIPFIALLFSIAFFYHNQIFYYFFNNSDYRSVSVYLPWLILSGGLFSIGQAFTIQMLSKMKTNRLAKIKIFTSSVGFFLNFLFAFYLGVLGVVIANLLFSFLFLIIIIYYNRTR
jgi:O-antigen/teichoic acid export membrane protein